MRSLTDLFTYPSDDMEPLSPKGFEYRPDFILPSEETALIEQLSALNFGEIRMHGVVAKRRVVHFGWVYGYDSWRLVAGQSLIFYSRGENMPPCWSDRHRTNWQNSDHGISSRGRHRLASRCAHVRTFGGRALVGIGLPVSLPTRIGRRDGIVYDDVGSDRRTPGRRISQRQASLDDRICVGRFSWKGYAEMFLQPLRRVLEKYGALEREEARFFN